MSEKNSILPASAIDRRLLRSASKYETPQQMSEAVMGKLSPAQCVDRVHELLEQKTMLDEVKERRMLLYQMTEHLDWMKSQRGNEKAWSSIVAMFKVVSDQIERSNINLTDVSSKLGSDHARYFIDGYMVGFERMIRILAERQNIEIPEEIVLEVLDETVRESKEYIDRVTLKEIE